MVRQRIEYPLDIANASSKDRIEVRDFSPRFSGRCSAQAKETRCCSLLPCRKKHVTRTMSLCDYAVKLKRSISWVCSKVPETQREDYKNVRLKDTTDMPSRCEGHVMFSKAHEASFHGHFANLPVEVCSTLKLQPSTNNTL